MADPAPRRGLRTRYLESMARDIERFDPNDRESTVDDYLREVDRCLLDLPEATAREKLKLIWKTTSRSVQNFMGTLALPTRDNYPALCNALREEYSPFTDPAAATLGAFEVLHRREESPKEYYRRLRVAYFQGHNAPGLEEDSAFRSLFLHNLHESIRYDVTMHCQTGALTMKDVRRYAQVAWQTRAQVRRRPERDARVLGIQATGENPALTLEGPELPRPRGSTQGRFQGPEPPHRQENRHRPHGGPPRRASEKTRQYDTHPRKGRGRGDEAAAPRGTYGKGGKAPTDADMKAWIAQSVAEAVAKLDRPDHPSRPQTPPMKPEKDSPPR